METNQYTWNGIDYSSKIGSRWKSKTSGKVMEIISLRWLRGYGILVKYKNAKTGERYAEGSFSQFACNYSRV